MRIIKGYVGIDNINVMARHEALDRYISLCAKYFKNVGNCMPNVDISNMEESVFFYSTVLKLSSCGACHGTCVTYNDTWEFSITDSIWENTCLNSLDTKFMRSEASEFTHRLCNDSILITLRGSTYNRVIGEFCPNKKILLATDWTNDDSKISFMSDIFTLMEKSGLLTVKKHEKKKPNIMLGADPELELVDGESNEIIHCRNAGIRDRVLKPGSEEGRIGQDGAGAQRELRPEPSSTPEGLVSNIEKLITQALDEVWCLQGDKYPLGGHIHIGGVDVSYDYGKLMDYYLGPLSELNGTARVESGYGKPGTKDSIRKQPHGIEFRTPPAAWLASKELALLTLTIAKLAAEKHFAGDDVTLTDNIEEDLVALGLTQNEMRLFFSEIQRFKAIGLPRDMKRAWGFTTPPKFILEFRDAWSESVKVYIDELMKKIAQEENLGGRCVFYGLGSERGNVFSVLMSNMNGIDMPEDYGFMPPLKSGSGKNWVGMPASIRTDISQAKKMKDIIVDIIKRTINPPKAKRKVVKTSMGEIAYSEMRGSYPSTPSPWLTE